MMHFRHCDAIPFENWTFKYGFRMLMPFEIQTIKCPVIKYVRFSNVSGFWMCPVFECVWFLGVRPGWLLYLHQRHKSNPCLLLPVGNLLEVPGRELVDIHPNPFALNKKNTNDFSRSEL